MPPPVAGVVVTTCSTSRSSAGGRYRRCRRWRRQPRPRGSVCRQGPSQHRRFGLAEYLEDRQRVRPDGRRQVHPFDEFDDFSVRSARAVALGVGVLVVGVSMCVVPSVAMPLVMGVRLRVTVVSVVLRPIAVASSVGQQHVDTRCSIPRRSTSETAYSTSSASSTTDRASRSAPAARARRGAYRRWHPSGRRTRGVACVNRVFERKSPRATSSVRRTMWTS